MSLPLEKDNEGNTSARPRRRQLIRFLAALVAICTLYSLYAYWPRSASLEPHTTTGFTLYGKSAHMELLIPTGWRVVAEPPPNADDNRIHCQVVFEPRRQDWMPLWLKNILQKDRHDRLTVVFDKDPFPTTGGRKEIPPWSVYSAQSKAWFAGRLVSGKPSLFVSYRRAEKSVFDATFREVCNSVKVVR